MAWFYLESLIALSILLGIVWWTMAPSRKPRAGADREPGASGDAAVPRDGDLGSGAGRGERSR